MPASSEFRNDVIAYFVEHFGVPHDDMDHLVIEVKQEEIWACTASELPGIHAARPSGLRIGRAFPHGIKPTSVFLSALGPAISQSRLCIEERDLRPLLLGQRVPYSGPETGYVALDYLGDVLGCGRVHQNRLRALIPTGRRKALLEILQPRS